MMSTKIETNIKEAFLQYSDLMQADTIGVKLTCYSVALVGLTVAMRRVRPFSRFKNPSDIPNSFINQRRELLGKVEYVEPNKGLLMIQHRPLISLSSGNHSCLPVKISGVNVTENGVSWLHAIVTSKTVKFIPVLKDKEYLHCIVRLPQQVSVKKQRTINVGETLLSVGFGNVAAMEKSLVNSFEYSLYYNRLKAAEAYAVRKRLGLKYYVKPTQEILLKVILMINYVINRLMKKVMKPSTRRPKVAAVH